MIMRVEMLGTEDAVKKIRAGIEDFINRMNDVHRASAEYVRDRAKEFAPVDTGQLAGSITVTEKEYDQGNYFSASTATRAKHARFAEFGTLTNKKGKPPPLDNIAAWAQRHGINPYALQKSIGGVQRKGQPQRLRGARPHPFHYKAFFEDQTFVEHREAIAETVVKFLEDYNAT